MSKFDIKVLTFLCAGVYASAMRLQVVFEFQKGNINASLDLNNSHYKNVQCVAEKLNLV